MLDRLQPRICFLAGTLGQGGAERQLFHALEGLRNHGATPTLVSLTRDEYWQNQIKGLGVPVICLDHYTSKMSRLNALIKTLRQIQPQVIQSQHFYTNLYATFAARRLGLTEIGALRNDAISEVKANGPVFGPLSLKLPRNIIANSETAIRNAVTLGVPATRLQLLPNVVDTSHFKPKARDAKQAVTLIAAGRLVPQKGMDRFLRTVSQVRRSSTVRIKALIFGDGPLRKQLEQQASDLGLLPDTLDFRGNAVDMAAAYREADILVLTSNWEGTPNVLLEAMASGLPVVATAVGGAAEIIKAGKNGYLVEVDDETAVIKILLALIDDRQLRERVGRDARTYVEANHSLHLLPSRLSTIYEKIVS